MKCNYYSNSNNVLHHDKLTHYANDSSFLMTSKKIFQMQRKNSGSHQYLLVMPLERSRYNLLSLLWYSNCYHCCNAT